MTHEQRLKQLGQAADSLLEKMAQWVQELDPMEAKPQEVRQLCGTLKDLKDLCRELEGPREEDTLQVIFEGGEESWRN